MLSILWPKELEGRLDQHRDVDGKEVSEMMGHEA